MKLLPRFALSAALLGATGALAQSFTFTIPIDIKEIPAEFVAVVVFCTLYGKDPVTSLVSAITPGTEKTAESKLIGGNAKTTLVISYDAAQFPDPYKNKPEAIAGYSCGLNLKDNSGKVYSPFVTGNNPGLMKHKVDKPYSVNATGNF